MGTLDNVLGLGGIASICNSANRMQNILGASERLAFLNSTKMSSLLFRHDPPQFFSAYNNLALREQSYISSVLNNDYSAILRNAAKPFPAESLSYSKLISSFVEMPSSIKVLQNVMTHAEIFSSLNLENTEDAQDNSEAEISISDDVVNELKNDWEALSEEKLNWQHKFNEFLDKWKSKNPIIAKIIIFLFINIVGAILQTFVGIAINHALIREEPNTKAETVCILEPNQSVHILGKDRYYYYVEIEDETEEDAKYGWVAIRNIQHVNNEIGSVNESENNGVQ